MNKTVESGSAPCRLVSAVVKKSERGQGFVMLVLGIVVLLGFAALAIDGGNYFSHRRMAQNASDAGAMAGSFAMVGGPSTPSELDLLLAIQELVEANRIPDSSETADDGINTHIRVFYTYADGTMLADGEDGADYNCDEDGNCLGIDGGGSIPPSILEAGGIRVEVGYPLNTYLAGFVGWGQLPVEASATGVFRDDYLEPVAGGNAIVSLSPDECEALKVTGGASAQTLGGGIHVNSNANTEICPAAKAGGGGFIDGGEDGISVVGSAFVAGGGWFEEPLTVYPDVDPIPDPLAFLEPPDFACTGPALNHQSNGEADVLWPGHYSRIKQTGGNLTLMPGIYCIDSPQKNEGLTGQSSAVIEGVGVMLYFKRGTMGPVGQAFFHLTAMTTGNYAGMLIFSDWNNSNPATEIKLAGGAGTFFIGTIYAPNTGCVVAGDAAEINVSGQVICRTVEVTGSGIHQIHYNQGDNYQIYVPPEIALND